MIVVGVLQLPSGSSAHVDLGGSPGANQSEDDAAVMPAEDVPHMSGVEMAADDVRLGMDRLDLPEVPTPKIIDGHLEVWLTAEPPERLTDLAASVQSARGVEVLFFKGAISRTAFREFLQENKSILLGADNGTGAQVTVSEDRNKIFITTKNTLADEDKIALRDDGFEIEFVLNPIQSGTVLTAGRYNDPSPFHGEH